MAKKLHELLAVESSLEKAANKLMQESLKTLNKETLFNGQHRTLKMFREEDKDSELSETQLVETTVDENIDYIVTPIAKWIDVVLRKDVANTSAKADLVVESKTIAKDLPATFLLGLENKIQKYRPVLEAIPTLPPGRDWRPDTTQRKGIWIDNNPQISIKSRKDPEFRVVAEATVQHPAQIREVERVLDVGRYVTTSYSGKMTSLEKAERLKRLDVLLHAVKQARMRANDAAINNSLRIGEDVLAYINTGKLPEGN